MNSDQREIDKIENLSEVNMFPNPANNYFDIVLNSDNASIELISITGEVVYKSLSNALIETVHVQNLSSGVYTVVVTENDKAPVQSKLTIVN